MDGLIDKNIEDVQSAKIMVEYLGQISNNQHTVLPTNGFN